MASDSHGDVSAFPPSISDSDPTVDRVAASTSGPIEDIVAHIGKTAAGGWSLALKMRPLTFDQRKDLAKRKLHQVHEGKLTVSGHVCVSESYSEQVSRLLFTSAPVDSLEEFDGHQIPLLHLATYCGNKATVGVLLGGSGIDFKAEDDKFHTILHMAVKGGDPEIVHLILNKAHSVLRGKKDDSTDPRSFANFLNSEDGLRMTALQHAAWEGCDTIIAELGRYDDDLDVSASGDHGFSALHLASWNGHAEAVELLLGMKGIDIDLKTSTTESLHWISGASIEWIQKQTAWIGNVKNVESLATRLHLQESHLKPFSNSRQYYLGLQETRQREMSSLNEDCATRLLSLGLPFVEITGLTALHCAAYNGHTTVVELLMGKITEGAQVRTIINPLDELGLTPLHHAVILRDLATVEMLLSNGKVRGNVKDSRSGLTPLDMAHRFKDVRRDRSIKENDKRNLENIIALLVEQADVKAFIDRLYKDRQLFVDAANAILVGAALIASITFAGWLQPPLNYQQYYGTDYLLTGAAPPDTYASYAAVRHHVGVVMFWIFNSLSFFFAIATVLLGACVVLPMLGNEELENDVSRMRTVHIWTTLALNISVLFVLGAFIAAGFAVLPPTFKYQLNMIVTSLVGGSFAFSALCYYSYRVFTLVRMIEMKTGGMKRKILRLERVLKTRSRTTEKDSRPGVDVRLLNLPPGVKKLTDSFWEFYSPSGPVELDIIFFHGLQVDDDYENAFWKTWVAKDNDEVIWPKEWLSKKLPNARILSVSYGSNATSTSELSEDLVSDIILSPLNIGRLRPVFLVGHCLGGIVLKHFFVDAVRVAGTKPGTREHLCRTFVDNVKGVFCYATPHGDSGIARFASRQKNPSPTLRLLRTIDTEKARINNAFSEIRVQYRIPAYEIGEALPTSYLGFKDVIVHEASVRQDVDMYYKHSTADHFSVCKARDPNDPTVIVKLVSFTLDPTIIELTWEEDLR